VTRRERNDRIFLSFLLSLFPPLFLIVCKHCSLCLIVHRSTFLWYIFLSPILYYFPIIFVFNFSICTLSSYLWYCLQLSMLERICIIVSTVKLGYNELGYNELPVITNRFFQFFQSQTENFYIIQPCYNESRLLGTNFAGPKHVRYNRVSLYVLFLFLPFFASL
jgi:hypothetical protein